MSRKIIIAGTALMLMMGSCTKLEEKYNSNITFNPGASAGSNPNVAGLLTSVYNSLRGTFQGQAGVYALWEMTTDELIGPTRGGDWDDNGAWRVIHTHRFDADHIRVREVYTDLLSAVFQATDLLRYNPTPRQAAEARFIRAFANFMVLDGWDQVPYREPGESTVGPAKVRKGLEALNYIISEVTEVMANLPDGPAPTVANKDAARVLLMKCYLNKAVFENRTTPNFQAADMQQVIKYADEIGTTRYRFSNNYYDNFAPNNGVIGRENIWVQENVGGTTDRGDIRSRWHSSMHYNQFPSGWNGFSTLSDFYNKFEASDVRRGTAYPTNSTVYTNPGNRVNVGLLVGQQYDLRTDAPLKDRTGANLVFTPEVDIIEKGTNLERTGIRAYKYAIDYPNADNGFWDNDYVYFRYADVLLMKAEALMRSNQAALAVPIIASVRANRGASALANPTLDNLIDERGRELYLESWRRQDLIRFGKFLDAREEKPRQSEQKYLLFPIPNGQLAANPNLTQNPGY